MPSDQQQRDSQLTDLTHRASTAEGRVARLESDIETLKGVVASQQANIEALHSEVTTSTSSQAQFIANMNAMIQSVTKLELQIASMAAQAATPAHETPTLSGPTTGGVVNISTTTGPAPETT